MCLGLHSRGGEQQGRSILDHQVGQEGANPCSSPLSPPLAATSSSLLIQWYLNTLIQEGISI